MNNHTFNQLDESLIKALKAIGIKSSSDLAKVSPSQIWADLEQLVEYFPEHKLGISQQSLIKIHTQARAEVEKDSIQQAHAIEEAEHQNREQTKQIWRRGELRPEMTEDSEGDFPRHIPEFRPAYGSQLYLKERGLTPGERQERPVNSSRKRKNSQSRQNNKQTKSHAMRCRSSARTFIGALLTMIMVPCIPLIMLAPIAILVFELDTDYLLYFLLAYVGSFSLYFLYCRKVTCQVCHIHLFTLRVYPHSTYAHKYPLMNHAQSVAWHIFCRLWFRCPACGTAQQLFKAKRTK